MPRPKGSKNKPKYDADGNVIPLKSKPQTKGKRAYSVTAVRRYWPSKATYDGIAQESDWHQLGRCRKLPKLDWVPDDNPRRPTRQQIVICGICPVQVQCFKDAMEYPETDGIRAGTTKYQRDLIRKNVQRASCPRCESVSVIKWLNGQLCITCGTTWLCVA